MFPHQRSTTHVWLVPIAVSVTVPPPLPPTTRTVDDRQNEVKNQNVGVFVPPAQDVACRNTPLAPPPQLVSLTPEDSSMPKVSAAIPEVENQIVGTRSQDVPSKTTPLVPPEVVSSSTPKASSVSKSSSPNPEECISGGSEAVKRQVDARVLKVNARSLRQWARRETSHNKSSRNYPVLFDTIQEGDVFCERGSRSNLHEGNRRYRSLIMEYRSEYQSKQTRKEKIKLSQSLVDQIHDRGGRFLKKVTKDPDKSLYAEIPPIEARLKVSQALRERKALKLTL